MANLIVVVMKIVTLVAVTWVSFGAGAEAEADSSPPVTCTQVVRNLMPCLSYVRNGGAVVPEPCCNGVKTLYGLAQTPGDRQNVCSCLKSAVNGYRYNPKTVSLAAEIPGKCGVKIPYKISPSTDCKSVK